MSQRGFTLIETLVALVILAVGLLAVAQMSITYVRANTQSQELSEAVVLAQDKMEQLRRYGTTDQPGNFAIFGFNYLISTATTFTTLADGTVVPGLISGTAGNCGFITNVAGTTRYERLSPIGGGTFGNGAVYGCSDTVGAANDITRTWTVQPVSLRGEFDYAIVTVQSTWPDRAGNDRSIQLQSLFNRR
ncbi:MAG: type IV pilus modification protein PilV [Proteobacteria bacterium]|nr:type IV pilus modification protein PilV [Pseudomonadota bacterium]